MIVFPNIKINLGLYITGMRDDGFHNLLSCFYPVEWTDILEIVPASKFEFTLTGLQVDGNPEENLCVKAFRLMEKKYAVSPVKIHLHKIIPMGAGLGGGSSDASYVLKAVNSLFGLNIPEATLESHAAELGSDCAFFIRNQPAIAKSRGDVLEPVSLSLKGKHIVIVCPGIHVSTAQAFKGVKPGPFDKDFTRLILNIQDWKQNLYNQFEDSIFPMHPLLEDLKRKLYDKGAIFASMSGSGSSIFGIFDHEPEVNFENHIVFRGIL